MPNESRCRFMPARWRFRCRAGIKGVKESERTRGGIQKGKGGREPERKKNERARQDGRGVNCRTDRGWRVNTASTGKPHCASEKKRDDEKARMRDRQGERERERERERGEGEGRTGWDAEERAVEELLTVDSILLFRRTDWSRERIYAMRETRSRRIP